MALLFLDSDPRSWCLPSTTVRDSGGWLMVWRPSQSWSWTLSEPQTFLLNSIVGFSAGATMSYVFPMAGGWGGGAGLETLKVLNYPIGRWCTLMNEAANSWGSGGKDRHNLLTHSWPKMYSKILNLSEKEIHIPQKGFWFWLDLVGEWEGMWFRHLHSCMVLAGAPCLLSKWMANRKTHQGIKCKFFKKEDLILSSIPNSTICLYESLFHKVTKSPQLWLGDKIQFRLGFSSTKLKSQLWNSS